MNQTRTRSQKKVYACYPRPDAAQTVGAASGGYKMARRLNDAIQCWAHLIEAEEEHLTRTFSEDELEFIKDCLIGATLDDQDPDPARLVAQIVKRKPESPNPELPNIIKELSYVSAWALYLRSVR